MCLHADATALHCCHAKGGMLIHEWHHARRESMNMPLDRHMPYELKALECALAVALRILSRDCAELDAEARSPLERLTHKVCPAHRPGACHAQRLQIAPSHTDMLCHEPCLAQ